jgi:Tfp pilus assembly protein PilV
VTTKRRTPRLFRAAPRPRIRFAGERGLLLVEVVVASFIFMIVSTALVGLLVTSTSISALVKQRTIAEQGVSDQIEKLRGKDYDTIATTGAIPTTQAFTGVNGENLGAEATMSTQITYASANVPGSAGTGADYKKIVVKITRNSDGKLLAQATTILAPKKRPSQTTATISAQVIDVGNNAVVPGVEVDLATGPSAPLSDLTDSGGKVTFAGLTPNPTSGSQAYYDLSVVPPAGYVALSDTVSPNAPAHVQLSPTQWWSTALDIYQPVTIGVSLQNPDSSPYTGNATVTVTSPRPSPSGTTKAFSYTGTPLTITTLAPPSGELLVPNINYTLQVTAPGYQTVNDSGTVPSGSYPTSLTRAFTETMNALPLGTLNVTVTAKNGTLTCKNATVQVTGGPASVNLTQSTSSTGAPASFTPLVPDNTYTVKATSTAQPTIPAKTLSNQTVNPGPSATALTVSLGSTSFSSC